MKVTFENWHHQCADGCCDRYGIDVLVNDELLGSIEDGDIGTAEALVELVEDYFKQNN